MHEWNSAAVPVRLVFQKTTCSGGNGTQCQMERRTTTDAPPTERELIQLVRERLGSTLPAGWSTEVDRRSRRADAVLRLSAPDGRSATLVVEAKTVVDARDVPAVRSQMRLDDD